MKKNVSRWIPPVLWGILLAVLSLMPGGQGDFFLFGIPHIDKLGHFGMYAIWTFLIARALHRSSDYSSQKIFWFSFLTGCIIGVVLEYGQYTITVGRSFEIADMVANAVGSAVGAIGYFLIFQKNKANRFPSLPH